MLFEKGKNLAVTFLGRVEWCLTSFFRPTQYGSRQVVYQDGKPVANCKFTELMQSGVVFDFIDAGKVILTRVNELS